MTTDINGTVTGIQGNPISPASPSDGYVLTWSAADGYWVGRPGPTGGMTTIYFTANTTWTCPAGVTSILVIGCGGGGGGGGTISSSNPRGGGGGALQQTSMVAVIPGNTYNIVIGAGGAGHSNANGDDGSPTILNNGSINLFYSIGACGGTFSTTGGINNSGLNGGGTNIAGIPDGTNSNIAVGAGTGGQGGVLSCNGAKNYIGGYLGGSVGNMVNNFGGGGGGGAGPQGSGGAGGNANGSGIGGNGLSANMNTGAGGGGGAWGSSGNGAGGNGGSGYLYIIL